MTNNYQGSEAATKRFGLVIRYTLFVIRLCENICPARGGSSTWFFNPLQESEVPSISTIQVARDKSKRVKGKMKKAFNLFNHFNLF